MNRIKVIEKEMPVLGTIKEVSFMMMNFFTQDTTCQVYYTLFTDNPNPFFGYLNMNEDEFDAWGRDNKYIEDWGLVKLGLERYINYDTALIEDVRLIKIRDIINYDISDAVNSFELFGQRMWLDRNTRMALMQTAKILDSMGEESTKLWTEGDNPMPIEVSLLELQYILSILEIYAKKCYDVTAQHKYNIQQMDNKEDILAYDHTANYPDKIIINTPNNE